MNQPMRRIQTGLIALAVALSGAATAHAAEPVELLNPTVLILPSDYPATSARNGEEGTVEVRLGIDATGAVKSCAVTTSSTFGALDDQTCTLLQKRAKFRVTASESPPADGYSAQQKVVWRLPGARPRNLFLGVTVAEHKSLDDGRTRCRYSDGMVWIVAKGYPCATELPTEAIVDGNGNRQVDIVEHYRLMDAHRHDPANDFAISMILAEDRYPQALEYLARASDDGAAMASMILCAIHAVPMTSTSEYFDPAESVRRGLMADRQGLALAMVVVVVKQVAAAHPETLSQADRQKIAAATPQLPLYSARPELVIPADQLIRSQDYPRDALKHNIQGVTLALFHVTAEGRVDTCYIMQSSLSWALDATVCRRLREAGQFTPAVASGMPTDAWKTQSVRWQIPHNGSGFVYGAVLGATLGALVGAM